MEKNETIYKSVLAVSVCTVIGVASWFFAEYGLEALEINKDKKIEQIRSEREITVQEKKLILQKSVEEQLHKQWLYRSQVMQYQWKSDSIRLHADELVAKYQWKSDSLRNSNRETLGK
jgi:uncharacterized protein YlzI (FlbEa/FlbD family)